MKLENFKRLKVGDEVTMQSGQGQGSWNFRAIVVIDGEPTHSAVWVIIKEIHESGRDVPYKVGERIHVGREELLD